MKLAKRPIHFLPWLFCLIIQKALIRPNYFHQAVVFGLLTNVTNGCLKKKVCSDAQASFKVLGRALALEKAFFNDWFPAPWSSTCLISSSSLFTPCSSDILKQKSIENPDKFPYLISAVPYYRSPEKLNFLSLLTIILHAQRNTILGQHLVMPPSMKHVWGYRRECSLILEVVSDILL